MSTPRLDILQADDDDALAAFVAVRNAVDPKSATTVEETRFFAALEEGRVSYVAVLRGEPVGAAHCSIVLEARDAPVAEGAVRVLAGARRQGVGSALLGRISAHARSLGKSGLRLTTYESEPEALAFLRRRGFEEVSRSQTVALDLDRFVPGGRPLPEGLELVDLAARPDLLRGLWEVETEALADIPGPESDTPLDLDGYRRLIEKPGLDHRLIMLAVTPGGEVVGSAVLNRSLADPAQGYHWMTAVRRSWRGRGVAGAVKEAQLARAKQLGLRVVRTNNELRNEPIRRLNDRLGYVREPDMIVLDGPLAPAATP